MIGFTKLCTDIRNPKKTANGVGVRLKTGVYAAARSDGGFDILEATGRSYDDNGNRLPANEIEYTCIARVYEDRFEFPKPVSAFMFTYVCSGYASKKGHNFVFHGVWLRGMMPKRATGHYPVTMFTDPAKSPKCDVMKTLVPDPQLRGLFYEHVRRLRKTILVRQKLGALTLDGKANYARIEVLVQQLIDLDETDIDGLKTWLLAAKYMSYSYYTSNRTPLDVLNQFIFSHRAKLLKHYADAKYEPILGASKKQT